MPKLPHFLKRNNKMALCTRNLLLNVWEYAGEIILAILVYFLLRLIYGPTEFAQFYADRHSDEAVTVGVVLAVCVAICGGFWGLLTTEFGKWLRTTNNATAYSRAFVFPVLLSLINLTLLVIVGADKAAADFATILLLYNLINVLTMLFNLHGLVKLWQDWENSRAR